MNEAEEGSVPFAIEFKLSKLPVKLEGTVHWATTDKGSRVRVWKPGAHFTTPRAMYFCHGHSLGTYGTHKYSVLGDFMLTVMEDEYDFLGFDSNLSGSLRSGDLALWVVMRRATDASALQGGFLVTPEVQHSALVINPHGSGGIRMSSKNGFDALQEDCTLADVMKVYERTKSSIQFYRRKPKV